MGKSKTEWRGWTLADEDGNIVTTGGSSPEPFTFARKSWAEDAADSGNKVVRCVVKVEKGR